MGTHSELRWKGHGPFLATCLVLFGSSACQREQPRDLLLVTIDTLRADMVGAYGHGRPSTPNLDRLASRGRVFERHYSTAPMTVPSHATLFTGRYSAEHGVLRNGQVLHAGLPTLATELAAAGFQSAAVVGSRVLDHRFGLARGFESYDDRIAEDSEQNKQRSVAAERNAGAVVDSALALLSEFDAQPPAWMWVHVYDPHTPFEPPEQLLDSNGAVAFFGPRVERSGLYQANQIIANYISYEAEIAYTDRELGRLFAALESRPRGPQAVLAVTSDHGEGLGEHGYLGHGLYLYEEQLLVPLILCAPQRIAPGTRFSPSSSMIDLAATLIDACGLSASKNLPGRSLLAEQRQKIDPPIFSERPLFEPFDLAQRGRREVLAQHADRGHSQGRQVGIKHGSWKYIWSSDVAAELYDLSSDPAEAHNLGQPGASELGHFETQLSQWRAGLRPAAPSVELKDADTLEVLEVLGYR